MEALLAGIEAWPPVEALRASFFVYPLVNAAHIAAIGALVTAIVLMDLRILGWLGSIPAGAFIRVMRRVAIGAFVFAVASGLALFSIRASDYVENPAFLLKIGLLLAAGLNAAAFHRQIAGSGLAKASAGLSLVLWPATLVAGRFIGFV